MGTKRAIVIGITGQPGTGKSTITKLLRRIKMPVQSADQVVHDLLCRPQIIAQVEAHFPEAVVDLRIDRQRLAEIVFTDLQRLNLLENILHPLVIQQHKAYIRSHQADSLIALEIPLLYEAGSEKLCDYVIYTSCTPSLAQQRIKMRGWSKERYDGMLKRLLPDNAKKCRADYILDTNQSKLRAWHQLKDVLKEICNTEGLHAGNYSGYRNHGI